MSDIAAPVHYTASPSAGAADEEGVRPWIVWNTYDGLPPRVVFVGSMEEAGGIADMLNLRAKRKGAHL